MKTDLDAILHDDALKSAKASVQVVQLGQARELDRVVYEEKSADKLIPASNQKVITTACALETLGPDFQFRTALLRKDKTLALVGDGDPAFCDTQYVMYTSKLGVRTTTTFSAWAKGLKDAKLTKFDQLLVDDSVFDEELFNPNWPANQSNLEYCPEVSGLNFNANCLDVYLLLSGGENVEIRPDPATPFIKITDVLTVGGDHSVSLQRKANTNQITVRGVVNGSNTVKPFRVTIHEPALVAGNALRAAFTQGGVSIDGDVTRDRTIRDAFLQDKDKSGWSVLAVNQTPLLDVLRYTNKESNNLYAESLLRRVAATSGKPGSRSGGAEALKAFVAKAGATADDVSPDDGSGLSKQTLASSRAFCAVLAYMFHGDHRDAYISTLAVGGVDGTLEKRFNGPLKGRVFAKSGYVNKVRTLSGYLKTEAGEWYAFSILLNDITDGAKAKSVHERIVEAIDKNSDK
ncbi:MAG: D-alanyl-D-alanine carboxypeptidase/D-alanyl-D-alanine-endopeptidase [Tepidisphaeraceae bacterium]